MALPVSAAEAERRIAAIKSHPTIAAAARSLGVQPNALRGWNLGHTTPRDAPAQVVTPEAVTGAPEPPPGPAVKPHYTVRVDRLGGSAAIRVLAIGDAHDGPRIPKDRFRWIGALAADMRPDVIVQIGDFLSLDSLCRYDDNATLKGKAKPSLKEDLASFKEALAAFEDGLGGFAPERHMVCGNHEDRIWSFTNRTPEMADLLTENLHTILTDRGWTYSPYGVFHFYGGVAFTHVPLTTLGKPYGGMHAENQIARDALHDVVYGHSHKPLHKPFPKLNGRRVNILNLGCALPHGHIEEYAKHSLTGWGYGIYLLTIQHGSIQMADWRPMNWIEEQYGNG